MTSKRYFNLAGIFMIVYIVTYFLESFEPVIWINRIAVILFAVFAILGFYQKKKEKKTD